MYLQGPEPQRLQPKVSSHYNPEEDTECYQKQISYFDCGSFENKLCVQVPASHQSEPTKPIHLQNQLRFTSYSIGKELILSQLIDLSVKSARSQSIKLQLHLSLFQHTAYTTSVNW